MKFGILTAAMAMLLGAHIPAPAAEFPYDREILLDMKPLPGSKRVPILEIGADGRAQIDLWCRSGPAQVEVRGEAITFRLGAMHEAGCTPERSERDDAMMAALSEVSNGGLRRMSSSCSARPSCAFGCRRTERQAATTSNRLEPY